MCSTLSYSGSDEIQLIIDHSVQIYIWCSQGKIFCLYQGLVIYQKLFFKKCIILSFKWQILASKSCGHTLYFPYLRLSVNSTWYISPPLRPQTTDPARSISSCGRALTLQLGFAAGLFLILGLTQSWRPSTSPNI